MRVWLAVFFLFCMNSVWAADVVSGVWRNPQAEAKDSTIILSQHRDLVYGAAHARWNSASAVWHGRGQLRGKRLQLQILYTLNPNQWAPKVTLDLLLSDDGRALVGIWRNKKGESGPLRFEKVLPE